MILEIEFPESLIKKIKALDALRGGVAEMDELLVSLLDSVVTGEIVRLVGGEKEPVMVAVPKGRETLHRPKATLSSDVSGIADSLGDDAAEEEDDDERFYRESKEAQKEAERRLAQSPPPVTRGRTTSMSDSDLEMDMQIQDPESEAIGLPPEYTRPGAKAEDQFADLVGIPAPQEAATIRAVAPVAISRRKTRQRPLPKRGSVQGYGDETPADPTLF